MKPRTRAKPPTPIKSAAAVYLLKVTLADVEPPVWRRLRVPGSTPLGRLHQMLQRAFAWEDRHLHEWRIRGERYGEPVPDEPEYDVKPAASQILREVVPMAGTRFEYLYDLGDGWRHAIEVEAIETPKAPLRYAECVAGARACPPEDCGGPYGYADLLEILRDPTHDEHEDRLEWVGPRFDPEALDLARINRKLRGL